MDLILWRHAEAEDADGDIADLERCLTRRGEKQAKRVARWLLEHLPAERKILVSPALRTRQTADALGSAYEIEPRVAPGATAHDILTATAWPRHKGTVLVVGHQPSLGELASLLMTGDASGVSVRKGAVWWFEHRTRGGRPEAILRTVVDPERL
ncbi:MAG: histidine phosphatase family protein [Rhodocyclales bacterium]|nr:histidine phosphatase family protein [Rhodocyclales bacterium]